MLSLQEVGDPDALADLVDAIGGDWHQRISQHPDQRGIRVAWLSKPKITSWHAVLDFPPELPAVTVDDDGTTMHEMGAAAPWRSASPPPTARRCTCSRHT